MLLFVERTEERRFASFIACPAQNDFKAVIMTLIYICIAVLIFLAVICICVIYHCCRKYVCTKNPSPTSSHHEVSSEYEVAKAAGNGHQIGQASPSPPTQTTIPTIQNAVDSSPQGEGISSQIDLLALLTPVKEKVTESKTPPSTIARHQGIGSRKSIQSNHSSTRPSRITRITLRRTSHPSPRLPPASPDSQQPIYMDKVSITPEMFAPNVDSNSKKELILFKAASFTE